MPPRKPNTEHVAKNPRAHQQVTLAPAEADSFLDYVFSVIAKRPSTLRLREGAGVAGYLRAIARELEQGPKQYWLDRLAETIWGTLFQYARLPPVEKNDVVDFLQTYAETYLAGYDIETVVKWVQEAAVPSQRALSPYPRRPMSRRLSASGAGNSHFSDDLSERIYAAYHALRRARLHNARGRIAHVLNRPGLTTQPRNATLDQWGPYEVYERVKQYEAGVRARWEKLLARQQAVDPLSAEKMAELVKQAPTTAKRMARSVVDKWILLFRSNQ